MAGPRARQPSQRKTRIVATLGPASASPRMVSRLIRAGVDVFRLNFSHGSREFHGGLVRTVRAASAALGQPVAILADLSGPKLRLGHLAADSVRLRAGAAVMLVEEPVKGTESRIPVDVAGLVSTLRTGQRILLADGTIELRVVERRRDGVLCRVLRGGVLRSRQGLNLPGQHSTLDALTVKDRRDLSFALSRGVDAVAMSFVRGKEDVLALRRVLDRYGVRPFVVAKIEREEALHNLPAILEVCGGVMVARGDLGVEIGVENVPLAQKRIIREALRMHRPVITATQMLESMIERPTPTRAEVSDVANAVLEGTDALMLSAETAIGSHPVQAVATLAQVALKVEQEGNLASAVDLPTGREDTAVAIARAARIAARAVQAEAVAAFTESGRTARLVSSQRPARRLFGFTSSPATLRRLKFFWGITPLLVKRARSSEAMVAEAEALLLDRGLLRRGHSIVIVCGESAHVGATNTVKIHTLGDADGAALRRRRVTGGRRAGSMRLRGP